MAVTAPVASTPACQSRNGIRDRAEETRPVVVAVMAVTVTPADGPVAVVCLFDGGRLKSGAVRAHGKDKVRAKGQSNFWTSVA